MSMVAESYRPLLYDCSTCSSLKMLGFGPAWRPLRKCSFGNTVQKLFDECIGDLARIEKGPLLF
jgi:hypothetical protein